MNTLLPVWAGVRDFRGCFLGVRLSPEAVPFSKSTYFCSCRESSVRSPDMFFVMRQTYPRLSRKERRATFQRCSEYFGSADYGWVLPVSVFLEEERSGIALVGLVISVDECELRRVRKQDG